MPEAVAAEIGRDAYAHFALTIVEIADQQQADLLVVAQVYFALAEQVGLDVLEASIVALPQDDRWSTLARAALREDVHAVHGERPPPCCRRAMSPPTNWWRTGFARCPAPARRSGRCGRSAKSLTWPA